MKLVAGLGNPGSEHAQTRHNLGFEVIDRLAGTMHIQLEKKRFEALFGIGELEMEKVILIKPQTYMNLSGRSIRQFVDYWKLSSQELLAIHDDIDIALGKMKLAFESGSAGHRGVDSIIEELSTNSFYRLRVGIGRPEKEDPTDYVLSPFRDEEREIVERSIGEAVGVVRKWITSQQQGTNNE